MKKFLIGLLIGISLICLGAYTRSWTESTPTDSTVANQIDDYNRYLRVDVAERVEDYIAGFNSTDSNEGFYHVLFLEKSAGPSTPAANKYILYGLLNNSKCELAGKDEDGDEVIFTYGGKHRIGSGTVPQAFLYNTTEEDTDGGRESTIRWKGEQSGGEVTTLGYIEVSHDGASDDEKGAFKVMLNDGDDSDAPSISALKLGADGNLVVASSQCVLDEDDMASDSATQVPTQQSVKAYVDAVDIDAVGGIFGELTNQDDENNTLLKAHAYLANQDGIVMAVVSGTTLDGKILAGYVGATDNPAGAGTKVQSVENYSNNSDMSMSITFPVQSGKYFEVTNSSAASTSIYWQPIGTLVKPTDQD